MKNDPLHFSEHLLKSGLTVFFQHRNVPWFETIMVVGVGIRHDPVGKEGLSHLLEHCLSRGTEGMKRMNLVEFQQWIAARRFLFDLGSTRLECTQYQGKALTRHAKRYLTFLRDFLRRPLLESVEHEREIIRNERDESANPKRRKMMIALRGAAFGDHRMSSVNALPEDDVLDGLTIEDVRAMHERYYQLPNMQLVVVGGLREKRLLDTLEKVFVPEPNGFVQVPAPPPVGLRRPDPNEIREAFHEDGVQTVEISYAWHMPPLDHTHLVLLRETLRDMLMLRLREQDELTYDVDCDNDRYRDHSTMTITTEVAPENEMRARDIIEETIMDIPGALQVFHMKKAEYLNEIGFVDFSVDETIRLAAKTVSTDGRPRTLQEAQERYESVTAEDIASLLEEFINPEHALIGVIEW